MASIYTAGSASVQIVPDFSNAQRLIGKWFASQDDLKVAVRPDLDQADLARTRAALQAGVGDQKTKINVDIDRFKLAKNMVGAIDFMSGFGTIKNALAKLFDPGNIIKANLGGAAVAIGATLSQAAGSAALLPGVIAAAAVPLATLVVGAQGLGDAFSALASGDATKVAEAMKNLSKEAGQFVKATHALGDEWKALRFDVQNELFAGLAEKMTTLGEKGIPVLRKGMSGIAEEFNLMVGSIFDLLSSDSNLADFGHVMDNIREVIHEVALAARPLLEAFFDIATVGSDFLPPLVAGFGKLAQDFANFIQEARDSGALKDFISGALSALGDLLRIVGNVAGALKAIFTAALPAGHALLTILKAVTGNLRDFLNTRAAQNGLATFFDNIVQAVGSLMPAIDSLVQALVTGILPAMAQFASALAPVVNTLLVQFAEMIGELAPLVYPALAEAIAALVSAMAPLIPQFTEIVKAILPVLTELIADLAPLIGRLSTAVGDALVGAVDALAPLLPDIAEAIIAIAEAIVPWIEGSLNLAVDILPGLVVVLQGLAKVLEFIAPILPTLLTSFLAFKAIAGISVLIAGFSTALLGAAVSAERMGAARLSSGLLSVAGSAERAGGAVKGFAGFLGGPWGIAAALGVGLVAAAIHNANEDLQAFKDAVLRMRLEVELGGNAGKVAADKLAELRKIVQDTPKEIDALKTAAGQATGDTRGFGQAIYDAQTKLERNKAALEESEAALRKLRGELGPVGFAQGLATIAQENYNKALASGTPREQAAALADLKLAQANVATETDKANAATKTQLQLMQEQQDAILGAANAQLAYERSQIQVKDAVAQYNEAIKSGNLTAEQRAEAELNVRDALLSAADAAARKAAADNAGKSDTDIAKASNEAYLKVLKDMAAQMGENTPKAITDLIASLEASASSADYTKSQMEELGVAVVDIPNEKTVEIKAPTAEQKKALEDLGYKIVTLPNGQVFITLQKDDAEQKMQEFVNRKRAIGVQVNYIPGRGLKVQGGTILEGQGGIVRAFADGGFMPAGKARIVPPNSWRIIGDRVRDDEAYIPINRDARSREILATTAQQMGYSLLGNGGNPWAPPGLASMPTSAALGGGSAIRRLGDVATGPTSVAGFVNNGTVLTTDLSELSRRAKQGTQRALVAAGL